MDLKIELDEPLLRFESGSLVTGKVTVCNKTCKVQLFKKPLGITFVGKAWIWATTSVEIFFTRKILLIPQFNPESTCKTKEISPGKTEYPFEFLLPSNLPSSFTGKYGKVEYYADVTLSRVALPDRRVTMPFHVIASYDLNSDPDAIRSCRILIDKHVCCCCCRNGPIRVIFHVPRKGCIPGGFLQFHAHILNKSTLDLQRATVSLVQESNVYASKTAESETKVVCRMKGPSAKSGETKKWKVDNFPVPVPSVPPTNLKSYGYLHYITFQYTLKITVKAAALLGTLQDVRLQGSVPIIVGTVAFASPDGEEDEESTTMTTGTRGYDDDDDDEEDEVYLPAANQRRAHVGFVRKSSSTDSSLPPSYNQMEDANTPPPTYVEATENKPVVKKPSRSQSRHTVL